MADKRTKYRIIYEDLYGKIVNSVYKKGEQLPTEFMLVEEYGISRPTVAKALNDLQEQGLIERKVGVGTFVTHVPETTTDRYMALLVPDIGRNESMEALYAQIARSCDNDGFTLIWSGSLIGGPEERVRQMHELAEKYVRQGVEGVFVYPSTDIRIDAYRSLMEVFGAAGIPVQILYNPLESFVGQYSYDFIGVDNYRMGYVLARRMIDHGAGSPRLLLEEGNLHWNELMIKGFTEAVREAGLGTDSRVIGVTGSPRTDGPGAIDLDSFDALACSSDVLAADVIALLLDVGRRVPDDVQVIGFGNTRYAGHLRVSLTSVQVDWEELGKMAVASMQLRQKDLEAPPKKVLIDGYIIERESTRC